MATFDFRVLLETVEGKKTSYMSQSFVDTSVDLVLSASQVYNRITGSVSCSYQNSSQFSGSDFNTNFIFKNNNLLSSSLVGGLDTGSINFDAKLDTYDRLLRYKFIGDKVCTVLGLPSNQWVYVDQVRFPADDESNIFQGNINVGNAFVSDTLTFANNANVNSDIPFYIDTGSDRYIKFIDTRDEGKVSLIFGYDKDNDEYEINASTGSVFNIKNVNTLQVDTINATTLNQQTSSTSTVLETSLVGNTSITGSLIVSSSEIDNPLVTILGNVSSSGGIIAPRFHSEVNDTHVGNLRIGRSGAGGTFTPAQISHISNTDSAIKFPVTGNTIQLTSSQFVVEADITSSGNISSSGTIQGANLTIDDITIDGSTISDSGDLTISAGTDITLDAEGGDIKFKDPSTGLTAFQFKLDNTPEIDIIGDLTIDGSGDIELNAGGGDIIFKKSTTDLVTIGDGGHITASGNISASGTLNAAGATFGGDVNVTGNVTATSFTTQEITTNTSAGSTQFGDSIDDTHTLTGSVNITGSLNLTDNTRIKLGNQPDLQIFHNGTNSVISDTGAGELLINGSAIRVRDGDDGGTLALFTQGAGTELRHDNVKKFETSDGGINVSGQITASGNISSSGTITAGNIVTDGNLTVGSLVDHFGDPNTIQTFTTDAITFTAGNEQLLQLSEGSQDQVIVGDGGDVDFHVKAGGDNTLFAQGSSQRIGIGTATPTSKLQVVGDITATHITASGNISSSKTGSFEHGFFGGKVGIGTTSPAQKLDVSGKILTDDSIMTPKVQAAGSSGLGLVDDSGTLGQGIHIKDGGNVGINDTTPIAEKGLSIGSAKTLGGRIDPVSASLMIGSKLSTGQRLMFDNNEIIQYGHNLHYRVSGSAGEGNHKFYSSVDGALGSMDTTAALRMIISSSGNVGIGTTSPTNPLTVEGAISTSGNIFLQDNNQLVLDNTNNNNPAFIANQGTAASQISMMLGGYGNQFTKLKVETSKVSVLDGADLFVSGGLEVEENITTSGNITASGNISSSGNISGNILGNNGAITGLSSILNTNLVIGHDTENLMDFSTEDEITFKLNNSNRLKLTTQTLRPHDDDGLSLGTADDSFSDLFLASGAVIDFNSQLAIQQNNLQLEFSGMDGTEFVGHITSSGNISASNTSGVHVLGGKLGIGTAPGRTLHVLRNDGSTDMHLKLENNGSGDSGIQFQTFDGSNKDWTIGIDKSDSNKFKISNSTLLANSNAITIDVDEKVGIGNTNPTNAKLVVEGKISASDDLIISDGTRTLTYDVSAGDLQHAGATFHINKSNGVDTSFDNGTLYVDASANRVSIGAGTAPNEALEVIGNISASGNLFANQLRFGEPYTSTPSTILFNDINTLSSSHAAGLMWDFPNDDVFIYAHQSSSDQTRLVFESSDNLSDGMIFWFNDFRGPNYDAFPMFMQGDRLVINNPVDRRTTYHKDQNHPSSSWNGGPAGGANNVDFYLIKSGSTSVSRKNSLIFGDVSDSQVTFNGDITASGNISASGTIFADRFVSSGGDDEITFDDNLFVTGNITASGNISSSGTGTFNKLEIHNGTPTLVLKDLTDDDDHEIEFQDNSGNIDYRIHTSNDIFNIHAVSNTPIAFHTNDTERMRILNGGNVGIGVTDPDRPLEVVSGDDNVAKFFSTDDLAIVEVRDNNTVGHLVAKDNVFGIGGSGSLSTHNLNIMTTTGNVGIGTTSPSQILSVDGGNISASRVDASMLIDLESNASNTSHDVGTRFLKQGTLKGIVGYNAGTDTINLNYGGFDNTHLNIDSSGKVGIGTSSPVSSLHIAGNSDSYPNKGGAIMLEDTGAPTDLKKFNIFSHDGSFRIAPGNDADSAANSFLIATTNVAGKADSIQFGTHEASTYAERMRITGSKVGIGTTSPNRLLSVDGIFGVQHSDSLEQFAVNPTSTGVDFIVKSGSSGNAIFRIDDRVGQEVMFYNGAGNVGIGTTVPTVPLQVEGDISASGNLFVSKSIQLNDGTSYNDATLESKSDRLEIKDVGSMRLAIDSDGGGPGHKLQFGTGSKSTTPFQALMTISSSGNVGIGTTSPTKVLQVEGDISSSGHIYVQGDKKIFFSGEEDTQSSIGESGNSLIIVADDDLILQPDDNIFIGSGSTNYAVFDGDNQRFGIGTTSPQSLLNIKGTGGNTSGLIFQNSNEIVRQYFDNDNANSDFFITYDGTGGAEITLQHDGKLGLNASNGDNVGIGTTSPTEKLDVVGNIKARDKISSTTFESGFAGSGFRIETGSSGTSFTVDDLTVRGTMSVFELLIHQIRATNGSLFVSNTGKLLTASLSSVDNHFSMSFDTGSGYGHSFQVGDLVRAQRFVPSTNGSGSQVFKSDLHIITVNGTGSAVGVLSGSGNALETPQPGYEYVRIGSTTTTDRQGSIYLTADDDNAPFIDVIDQVTSHSHFNTSGRVKTRIGKLDGITTSTRFGTLSGYGFYASGSAFLEGSINATSGSIGDFIIDDKEIRDSSNDLRLKSIGQITASKALIKGNSEIAGFNITDSQIVSQTGTLILKDSGQITGSAVSMSGVITATKLIASTAGEIGGFTIDSDEIKSGNFVLDSDDESIRLGTVVDLDVDGSNKGFFASGSGGVFIGKEDGDFIKFDNDVLTISSSDIQVEVGDLSITASDIDMTTDKFELNATDIDISSTGKSISLGEGKIDLVGGSTSTITIGAANSIKFSDDGTDRFMTIGSKTSFSHFDQSTAGLILGTDNGTSKFEIVGDTNNYLSFNGTAFDLKSTNTTLSGSSVEILTPKFFFGDKSTSFISSSTSQIEISSSAFHLQNNGQVTGSKVLFDGGTIGGFEIDANNIKSTDENIILNSNSKKFSIGSSTFGGHGVQFEFNGGSPKLHLGRNGHSGIRFEGSQLQISSSKVDISGSDVSIQSPKVFLGTGDSNFISASDGNIEISSSNFHLQNNGDLTGSSVLFDGGTIGGFSIGQTNLANIDSSGGISIDAGNKIITARTGSASDTVRVRFGQINAGEFGIQGEDVSGNIIFNLGEQGNNIAGFDITNTEIAKNNITMSNANGGKITLNQGSIFLSGSGEGQFANGGITFDKNSNLTVSGTLSSSVGNIGGFTLDSTEIKSNNASGDTGLRLKAGGQITASNAKITGDIVANTITANTAGTIGGFGISATTISSSTGTLILRNNGQITASAVSMSGHITAETGTIGGFTLTDTSISASGLFLKSSGQLTASSVDLSGKINATSGEIGAIVVSSDRLQSSESADSSNLNIFEINKDGTIQIGKFEGGGSPFIITDVGKTRQFPSSATTPGGFSIGNLNNAGFATLQRQASLISINGDECKININQITGSKLFIDETSFLKGDVTANGNINSSATITAEHFLSSDDIVAQGKISASGNIEGSLGRFYRSGSFPQLQLSDDGGTDILNIGQSGNAAFFKTSNTTNDFRFRRSDNKDIMFLDMSALKVGIGTTSPSKKLHINNSGILIDGGSSGDIGEPTRFVIDSEGSTSHNLMDLRNDHGTLLFVDGNNDSNNFARVGIGINDPVDPLQVKCDSDAHGLTLEENSGGETYTLGVDSDGDLGFYNSGNTTPVMKLDDGGDLGIGTGNTNPSYRLTVKGNTTAISASGFIRFSNDHFTPGAGTPQMQLTRFGDNGGNNDGLVISYQGFDNSSNPPTAEERFLNFAVNNGSDANIYIGRFRGDGLGGIETTGIAFTGRHPSVINSGSYELGMIVESTGEVWAKSNTGVGTGIPKVQISTTDSSKKVFGVIGEWSGDYHGYVGLHGVGENEIDISINSIGEGLIWVTNKNGNIENGDFIVSSVISGYGQQQNDDLLRNSTVAKCTETIDWDNVTETITYNGVQYKKYLCTCTYHCG